MPIPHAIQTCTSFEFGPVLRFMEVFLHQSNDMVWENPGGYRFLHIADVWQLQHLAHIVLPDQSPRECVSRLEVLDVHGHGSSRKYAGSRNLMASSTMSDVQPSISRIHNSMAPSKDSNEYNISMQHPLRHNKIDQ
jgi:hypothetical protein